jgi:hypothetical protein
MLRTTAPPTERGTTNPARVVRRAIPSRTSLARVLPSGVLPSGVVTWTTNTPRPTRRPARTTAANSSRRRKR